MTRRDGLRFLKAGDIVNAVEKAMGLQKGEKINRLCQIRIISTREEPLIKIIQSDVIKEGLPDWSPQQFVKMLVDYYKIDPAKSFNRIEFEYLEGEADA